MLKRSIAVTISILGLAVTASVAVASGGLSGTYKTTIDKPAKIKGVWEVQFASGRDTIILNGRVEGHGHYTVSGSTLSFKPKGSCHSPGKYSFVISGTSVRFTKISDPCPSSRPAILSHTFTKV